MVIDIPRFNEFKSLQQYVDALDERAKRCMSLANQCVKINILRRRGTDISAVVDIVCNDAEEHKNIAQMLTSCKDPISVAYHLIEHAKLLSEILDAIIVDKAKA